MDGVVKILTLNCRGLNNQRKRRTFFRHFKQQKYDIICLQETYIKSSDYDKWKKEWCGQLFHSTGTTHSKGQLILINKHFQGVNISIKYEDSRILAVTFEHMGEKHILINAYGPSDSDSGKIQFVNELAKTVQKLKSDSEQIILVGDMNIMANNKLDNVAGNNHNSSVVAEFHDVISSMDVYDTWRLFHGEEKDFTWSSKSPFVARRLDYIFTSSIIFDKVTSCETTVIPGTDHKGVEAEIRYCNVKRGPSYWKLNNSLLKDISYVNKINQVIEEESDNCSKLGPQLGWDYIKIKIRDKTIEHSRMKTSQRKNEMQELRLNKTIRGQTCTESKISTVTKRV